MPVQKHTTTMEDYGDDYRLERESQAKNGVYTWIVFKRVSTGVEIHNEHKDHAKKMSLTPGTTLYPGEAIKKPGRHPVIKDPETGEPAETFATHVWVPVYRGSEKDARTKIHELSGEG
jgi:hypothetical protein